jgi:release factor glutamine methyltransferase
MTYPEQFTPTSVVPVLSRLYRSWKFRLFQGHRHRRLTLEHVDGVPILVLPEVFNPKLFHTGAGLARLARLAIDRDGMSVLDMGTGSGIGAIFAALQGARVVAVDINPEAVRCTRLNAHLNRVEDRIEVLRGDLFEPVDGQQFDLILFNPPFYRGEARASWELAWRSDDVLERFAANLGDALNPGGRALLMYSNAAVPMSDTLARHGIAARKIWERNLLSERLLLLELTLTRAGVS